MRGGCWKRRGSRFLWCSFLVIVEAVDARVFRLVLKKGVDWLLGGR
jgi:hypothetical protein